MMSSFLILGQTNGFVLDSDDNPIEKVSVYLVDQKIILYTNENGIFLVDQEIPDNSSMYFYKLGYAAKLLKYQKDIQFKVILEKLHVTLDEVGVTESFNELGNSRLTNIEKKSIENVFLNSNSMIESVAELSGVDMISSGLGIQKVVVRGLSGMRVVTYLNGIKINNQQWANDHGNGFTDLGLNEVELIKGASALKYGGEAIGGLLYFKDSPFVSGQKLNGFIATKFNNSSYLSTSQFGIKWNMRDFYFNLYGQYSLSSDYRLPNNDYLFNSRFKENAIKFSIAHRYKNLQNIFRYQLHAEETGIPGHVCVGDPALQDILDLTSSSLDFSEDYKTNRPSQFINNQLFVYESSYLINDLKLSLHTGYFINNLQEYEKWTRPAFDLTISQTQLTPNIRYAFNNVTLNFGTQLIILDNKNNIDDRLIPDYSSMSIGPYAIVDYEKDNIGFNSGLRYDYKKLNSSDTSLNKDYERVFSTTSFSAGLYYKISDNSIRLTYSGAFRSPHVSELFSNGVHHGTNRYELGNINLEIEYADQFDLKYQWSNDHFGFVLNPFVQYISNFISINPTGLSNSGYKEYHYVQYDNVELKGIEMNLHYHPHKLHNLHLEQSYSFLQANNKDSEYGLALLPANSITSKVLFDFNDFEKLSNYKLDYFSLYHIYKFQQNIYAEYEEPTASYNVVNLRLGFKINDKLHFSLAVNNLFNEEYTPHISRVRGVAGGVPNPGRFFSINLKHDF